MKTKLIRNMLTIALLFYSATTLAVGGVWILEITYQLKNKQKKGFVIADSWANDFDRFIEEQSARILQKLKDKKVVVVELCGC